MKKDVSKEKLFRKTQKALNREKHLEWAFKPISRVIHIKKKDAQKSSVRRIMIPDGAFLIG